MQNGDQRFDMGRVRRRLGAMLCFTACLVAAGSEASPGGPANRIEPPRETLSTPLHFKRHAFQAVCYDTLECNVVYNGRYQARQLPGGAYTYALRIDHGRLVMECIIDM